MFERTLRFVKYLHVFFQLFFCLNRVCLPEQHTLFNFSTFVLKWILAFQAQAWEEPSAPKGLYKVLKERPDIHFSQQNNRVCYIQIEHLPCHYNHQNLSTPQACYWIVILFGPENRLSCITVETQHISISIIWRLLVMKHSRYPWNHYCQFSDAPYPRQMRNYYNILIWNFLTFSNYQILIVWK